jgi:heterodisulfide reductase subunit A
MSGIGVFVCHCGLNIAGTVDVFAVADAVRDDPAIVLAEDYVYMCSEPGQALVRRAVAEHALDGVVVAACSPTMHESTFRSAASAAGLNPYQLEIANIREQVSWPHQRSPEEATLKAISAVRAVTARVRGDEPLDPLAFPVTQRALVVGGGIAGITAALVIARGGHPVVLVEREDQLGGHARDLSQLYLGTGHEAGLLDQRVRELREHPLVEVITGAEVTAFEGHLGSFTASLSPKGGGDGQAREPRTVDIGAVVLATGFELYDTSRIPEYGATGCADVIDSLEFERMVATGAIVRPSDGAPAREIVWVQCAGSRDPQQHRPYCSKICCMYVAKQATAFRRLVPEGQAYVFYIDIRSQGRGYDEYVQRATEDEGIVYLRGKVSKVFKRDDKVEVWGADTLSGNAVRVVADLVVLASAAVPSRASQELGRLLRAPTDECGFFAEAHPKLRPVESLTAGVYLAGAAQFPKDVPETVAQAAGAASKVLQLFSRSEMDAEPTVARVAAELCVGCGHCITACPYGARSLHPWKDLALVDAALCQSCGACAVSCPNKASIVRNDTPEQILAAIEAVLSN